MIIEQDIVTNDGFIVLPNGSKVHRFTHIVAGAEIGENVMIAEHCYVGAKAKIGNGTRIQNYVSVWDGVELGNNVFVAPRVTFTNHHDPSVRSEKFSPEKTIIKDNVTLCAACVIIAPCTIHENARIGAGSVVLRSVKQNEKRNGLIK